jgi:hypothetical protein
MLFAVLDDGDMLGQIPEDMGLDPEFLLLSPSHAAL